MMDFDSTRLRQALHDNQVQVAVGCNLLRSAYDDVVRSGSVGLFNSKIVSHILKSEITKLTYVITTYLVAAVAGSVIIPGTKKHLGHER